LRIPDARRNREEDLMGRSDTGPDFIEALARGIDVIRAFAPSKRSMVLSEVAEVTGLARPTVRRILLTLQELGYARLDGGAWSLTPRVLELGTSYVHSQGLWEIARPHMEDLVRQTGESTSIAQLDGSDIVYVARVAVPKIITFAVSIGTRFPALQTSLGKVLLAALSPAEVEEVLEQPSRSGISPRWQPGREERDQHLREVRARGWAVADEHLAAGIRSAAVPLRDGEGRVLAAMNVTVHAAETTLETLTEEHLPRLLAAAGRVSHDLALRDAVPQVTMHVAAP
jgi:IclR family transcriptional regulator, pca regulon regulatory protein